MKLSTLELALNEMRRQHGDLEVLVSSDPEGNSYGDLGDKAAYMVDKKGKTRRIVLFPVHEEYPD